MNPVGKVVIVGALLDHYSTYHLWDSSSAGTSGPPDEGERKGCNDLSPELDPKEDNSAEELDMTREPDCAGDRMTLPASEACVSLRGGARAPSLAPC